MLLIGTALVSASELAYFSLVPADIEKLKANKDKLSKTALKLYKHPEKLLTTILVTNNTLKIASMLFAVFLCPKIFDISAEPVLGFIIIAVITILLLLFLGEVMPKAYVSGRHISIARLMAYPLTIFEKILQPVTFLLISSASFIRKRTELRRPEGSLDNLSGTFVLTTDNITEDEKILKGIVNFGSINVSAIMCSRTDVTAIDIKTGFDKIVPVIISSGFSRIPVYSGSFDSVKGILYAKDVLPYTNNPASFKWQALLRPPYFVPETKKINDLLKEFQTKKIHMAVVIDEYGGTSGIVTLEDILEEIVGEITDEGDEDQLLFRKPDDKTFIFEARILLNDFYRIVNLNEDTFKDVRGESETLGGLILELTGEIPQKDQVIKHGDILFRIESADKRKIKEIRVEINKNDG